MAEEIIVRLNKLYEEGKCSEALEEISRVYPSANVMPAEIMAIKGWCHFRLQQYHEATEAALMADEKGSPKGSELLAQLAAYVSKDDKAIEAIRQKMPGNLSVCNAFAIRARDKDSRIPKEMIVEAAIKAMSGEEIAATNLINNTARLLLAKGDGFGDTVTAIIFWRIALQRYGDKNYHHRAAVHFWMSKAYESLGNKALAIQSALSSLQLWEEQVNLDPANPKFKESLEGARRRVEELLPRK
jgi:tetratricopeptide (TPR) repeat protein